MRYKNEGNRPRLCASAWNGHHRVTLLAWPAFADFGRVTTTTPKYVSTTSRGDGHNGLAAPCNYDNRPWEIPPSTPSLAKPSLTCFLLPLLALRPPPADDARFDPENFMHLMSARTLVSQHASSVCKSPVGAPSTVLGQRTISLESQDVEKWKRRAALRVQIGVGYTVHFCRSSRGLMFMQ